MDVLHAPPSLFNTHIEKLATLASKTILKPLRTALDQQDTSVPRTALTSDSISSLFMSDRYRPPSGPKGPRGPRGPPPSSYRDSRNLGPPRRGNDRDVYRPNDKRSDDRLGYYQDRNKNERYERPNRSDRPSGPSGFKGQKRGPPERDSRDDDRPNKRRDFSARDFDNERLVNERPTNGKIDMDRAPKAPRSSGGPGPRPGPPSGPRPGPSSGPRSGPPRSGPPGPRRGGGPSGPGSAPITRDKPTGPKKRIPNTINNKPHPSATGRKPQQRLQPSQVYSLFNNRTNELYKRVQQVGEGTYGKVYKAKNSITGEFVALKRLRLESEREGFPITAMREIKLLQSFDHPNIVGLLEMMVEHNQIFMIFDYLDHDLTGLLTHPDLTLSEGHRKTIFKQLMEGMSYLHRRRVIHRDIKGSNILLNRDGVVKVADFGLARTMKVLKEGESPDYTNRVITIWYRPPELLLGSVDYGREVDIWGVGCLLIELYTKMAIFQGTEEVSQLHKIFDIMGTPSVDSWPDIENLPWFEMLKPRINKKASFEKDFKPLMSEQSFDLAQKMLTLVPEKRLTADEVLEHPYFTTDPQPEPLDFMQTLEGEWHEFETKQRRREERKRLHELKAKGREVSLPPTQPKAPNPANETSAFQTPLTAEGSVKDELKGSLKAEEVENSVMGVADLVDPNASNPQESENDGIEDIEHKDVDEPVEKAV